MTRALSPKEALSIKNKTIPFAGRWYDLLGTPDWCGVWFIWGNSGNGKTGFAVQLAKEFARFDLTVYNSLEEGISLSMRNTIARYNMEEVNRRFRLLDCESIEDLSNRLRKPKSPHFVIIDSFQYTQMTYKAYLKFKEEFYRKKLIVFISHADGNNPSGRSAKSVMYDATEKIWVQGQRAFSKGRFIGPIGHLDIWPEGAVRYWGETDMTRPKY